MALFGEILAVLSLILVSIVSFLSLRNMNRYNSTFDNFKNLIGKDEQGNIVMDERIVTVIDAVGSRLFQSAKMSFLQGMSVDSKTQKGLEGAIALDVVEEKMPILEMAGDFLGFNTKAYIKKNPKAMFQLIGMINKASGGQLSNILQGNFMAAGSNPANNPGNRGRM